MPLPTAIEPSPAPTRSRLSWIDHIRTFVIILVVNMHACVTYSHEGSWYAMSEHKPSFAVRAPFILWQSVLQSFFMGLLFFVAGYFAHGSIVRRGAGPYVRERLFRLGLPTLFYMLVIHPFILVGINPWNSPFGPWTSFYWKFLCNGSWLSASGPHVVRLCPLGFQPVVRRLARGLAAERPGQTDLNANRDGYPLLRPLLLGTGSFAVRLFQPLGRNVLNMQLCYFSQYVGAFCAGIAAARGGWLPRLAESSTARRTGWLAITAGPLALLALIVLVLAGVIKEAAPFSGGWHWQAAFLAYWEQLTGVGLGLGVLAYFSARLNRETPLLRWLADRSFGVYLLHPPVLVALAMAFHGLPQNPYGQMVLLTVSGLIGSYILSDIARRIPFLRAII